ncbi:ABC transporter ATP-binding protein [Krasilnikoviella flava]|uniref:Peptide/nickel transport system ATP-binding protein n=1 Tax=Krasilnikoviella flava TaxID=526729 RepID=A0A1T5LZF6_9MICO|nr:ATP-binding cassette domain-containing protein [Krasilnikoviella flava]SKC81245.1 peptide/nickel transport system ATP-binding protein [Krasilnikoviella flava]
MTDAPHPEIAHDSASVSVRGLSVAHGDAPVLDRVDLDLVPGEVHVLLGPSGAGKSTLLSALNGALPSRSRATGTAVLTVGRRKVDLLAAPARTHRRVVRGRLIGIAPQGAGAAFTPTSTIVAQLREAQGVAVPGRARLGVAHPHRASGGGRLLADLAHTAGVDPAWLRRYPHQLSGGQLARLNLVAAMVNHPPVLLVDEPTSGLDEDAAQAVGVLLSTYARAGHSVLVVTHDLALARSGGGTVTRLEAGRVVARGTAVEVVGRSAPARRTAPPVDADAPALAAHGVRVLRGGGTVLGPTDLAVRAGEVVGLTGPSGVGKSTLASVLAQLEVPDTGHVAVGGARVDGAGLDLPPAQRRRVGWVSQHPRTAVDARMTLRQAIELPARLAGLSVDAAALAHDVGLGPELLSRRPHQVSGGELQRACVARALALRPEYLVLDEVTSMLDADTAADLLAVVVRAARAGTGVLLVSHDLDILSLCDRVLALRGGDDGAVLVPVHPGPDLVRPDPAPTREKSTR